MKDAGSIERMEATLVSSVESMTWKMHYGEGTAAGPGEAYFGWFADGELMFGIHMPPVTVRELAKAFADVVDLMNRDGL